MSQLNAGSATSGTRAICREVWSASVPMTGLAIALSTRLELP